MLDKKKSLKKLHYFYSQRGEGRKYLHGTVTTALDKSSSKLKIIKISLKSKKKEPAKKKLKTTVIFGFDNNDHLHRHAETIIIEIKNKNIVWQILFFFYFQISQNTLTF